MNTIKEIAARLLGRQLEATDGIDIKPAEERLGISLPQALADFYLSVGNNKTVTSSFQRFAGINELYYTDNKLVFLEENQGVCYWGVDLITEKVYQCTNEGGEWYYEGLALSEFLELILYYQFAEGGYEYAATLDDTEDIKAYLAVLDWDKVVDHNQLIIHYNHDKLIWYFTENPETVFLSTRTKIEMEEMMAEYGFVPL